MWVDPERIQIVMPTDFQLPAGGLGIRNPDPPLEAEKRLHGPKMAAVRAFVRANGFDRTVIDPPRARIGIMTTGKAYLDTRQALEDLGLSEERCRSLGIRLYKVGVTWPLEPEGARRFAEGLQEVIVVEEKRSNLEDQLVRILYNAPADRRPLVIGKTDEDDRILFPSEGELSPTGVAMVIANRLMKHTGDSPELKQRMARLEAKERLLNAPPAQGGAHAVLLLGLPAQHLDARARGQPRDGRHRLPRHGDLDAGPAHLADQPHGRRRRGLGRPGAVHLREAHLPESRRRHLLPLRPDGDPPVRRRRHQHHLQDPLQRRGRDDRRPAA